MGDNAISAQKCDIYEVKIAEKAPRENCGYYAWIGIKLTDYTATQLGETYWEGGGTNCPLRTWPGFVRQYSSSVRHTKSEANFTKFEALQKYRASRPTADEKLEACLYTFKTLLTHMKIITWLLTHPAHCHDRCAKHMLEIIEQNSTNASCCDNLKSTCLQRIDCQTVTLDIQYITVISFGSFAFLNVQGHNETS